MELINKDTPQVKEFISSLDSMLDGIESIVKHYKLQQRPLLGEGGDRAGLSPYALPRQRSAPGGTEF